MQPFVPLIALAIGSVYSGWAYIGNVVFGNYFDNSIMIAQQHAGLAEMRAEWHGAVPFIVHGLEALPFWLGVAGIATAWFFYLRRADLPASAADQQLLRRQVQRLVLRRRIPPHRQPAVGDR